MKYTVTLSPAAARDLKRLAKTIAKRVIKKYAALEDDPRPVGCEKLVDVRPITWRVRAGDWRVLYEIDDGARSVWVLAVLPRDQAYKR